jgi:hypothetical protein
VLNTPSHHRVHHGRNPKYIDRNHAGSLIIWDRMFGTFQAEEEEPVYGITKPLRSFNPIWANLHYWVELAETARRARRPLDRLQVFWRRPGWRPPDLGGFEPAPQVDRPTYQKYDPPLARPFKAYVLVQLLAVNLAGTAFLFRQGALPAPARVAGALLITASVLALGGLLERRSWALGLEPLRLLGAAAMGLWQLPAAPAGLLAAFAALSTGWLLWSQDSFRPRARPLRDAA